MNDDISLTRRREPEATGAVARWWPTYLAIVGLLLVMLVALAGGIIWYNSKKSSELAIAAGDQLMQEAQDKIIERIKLLYDPLYAIVAISSRVPEFTTPAIKDDPAALASMLRGLRIYPQMLALYVGFDSGDFFMVMNVGGAAAALLRASVKAPEEASFATEFVGADAAGQRTATWTFLADDGSVVDRRDPVPDTYDPRQRPWYGPAKRSEVVEHTDLYVFASTGEPGFTLSRSFGGATPGVMGADLAATDLVDFVRTQRITPGSTAFIFTKDGELIAYPDPEHVTQRRQADYASNPVLPKIGDLHNPVISGFVAAWNEGERVGTQVYDVAGRTYMGRVAPIPPRYGNDQLLAILVPVDEIERPIIEVRNQTLLYSVVFLVLALPAYATLIVAWIDRRLRVAAAAPARRRTGRRERPPRA